MIRKLKQTLLSIAFILLPGVLSAEPPHFSKQKLNSEQIAGLRNASQGVLITRQQAREEAQIDPSYKALKTFRQSLLKLHNELTTVHTSAETAITEAATTPATAASSPKSTARDAKVQQSMQRTIAQLNKLKQHTDERPQTLQSKHKQKRAGFASRRAERLTKLHATFQGFNSKTKSEQLEIVKKALAHTRLKNVREQQAVIASQPGLTLNLPTTASSTPTMSVINIKHRH